MDVSKSNGKTQVKNNAHLTRPATNNYFAVDTDYFFARSRCEQWAILPPAGHVVYCSYRRAWRSPCVISTIAQRRRLLRVVAAALHVTQWDGVKVHTPKCSKSNGDGRFSVPFYLEREIRSCRRMLFVGCSIFIFFIVLQIVGLDQCSSTRILHSHIWMQKRTSTEMVIVWHDSLLEVRRATDGGGNPTRLGE